MQSSKDNATQLFAELDRLLNQADYNKALKHIDKILKQNPNDVDALHCKVITLIKLEKYQNALDVVTNHFVEDQLIFERGYCLYRLNRWSEVLELTTKFNTSGKRELGHLKAQAAYRSEDFTTCLDLYNEFVNGTDKNDDAYNDILTNFVAAKAALLFADGKLPAKYALADVTNTYELAYNSACGQITVYNLNRAEKLLNTAKSLCRQSLAEEDYTEQEIEQELSTVLVQLAYLYQLRGKAAEATELYQSVLKHRTIDITISAVASNNLAALKKDQDVFDSSRKLRSASSKSLETKLFKKQRRTICTNEALIQLYMQKYAASQEAARRILQIDPADDSHYILLAAVSYRQKKTTKAIQDLQEFAKEKPKSLLIHFALVQLQLQQSNVTAAIATLNTYLTAIGECADKYRPGVVGLLVWLYEQAGLSDKSIEALEKAEKFWKASGPTNQSLSILRQTAAFKLKTERFREAAEDYKQLIKANPSDSQAIAGYIMALANYDISSAESHESSLPPLDTKSVADIDKLENVVPGVRKAYKKTDAKSDDVSKTTTKKKHKRKPLLPKNYDPNVPPDPERWLPKRERSTFRGKRKKQINKGSQGAAVAGGGIGGTGSANISGKSATTTAAAETSTPSTHTETAKPKTGGDKQKKKKKKGNKW
ncbi:8731_t:CDS:10 [Paraglomus occultum]|uniref:Signal recognition particle subunit SRP72 n=1 Tax=Paraglomus occultum TaxID=144539 RepID=A0A9N8VW26_9GLOM|nr:8731_t:CDS:10 [Paraglomus occultum]